MIVLHVDSGHDASRAEPLVRLMRAMSQRGVEQHCVCAAGSQLERRIAAEKMPVQGVPWSSGLALGARRTLGKHAKAADLIHAHDESALEMAGIVARLWRRPLVATCFEVASADDRGLSRASRIIAVSKNVMTSLIEADVPEDRIEVIHPGIDIDAVRALPRASPRFRDRLAIEADRFVAGTMGPMTELENQRLIARAAAIERRVIWAIVGDGPERTRIQAAIAAHGVAANVRLAGSPSDARPYIREFDVYVATAHEDPIGARILDAMALDVPVIAPDDAGPGEILLPVHLHTAASLYPPGDAAALAGLVRRVRDDERLRQMMIAAQRTRIEEYRIERTATETLRLYQELAEAA
jgi:glycosyltransferase involved in cell wall biosynthesis